MKKTLKAYTTESFTHASYRLQANVGTKIFEKKIDWPSLFIMYCQNLNFTDTKDYTNRHPH